MLSFPCLLYSLAFGNECGVAIIDVVQKVCLLNMGTPDLYGTSKCELIDLRGSYMYMYV